MLTGLQQCWSGQFWLLCGIKVYLEFLQIALGLERLEGVSCSQHSQFRHAMMYELGHVRGLRHVGKARYDNILCLLNRSVEFTVKYIVSIESDPCPFASVCWLEIRSSTRDCIISIPPCAWIPHAQAKQFHKLDSTDLQVTQLVATPRICTLTMTTSIPDSLRMLH